MKEISNNFIVVLTVVFIVLFAVQMVIFSFRIEKQGPITGKPTGIVSFCVGNQPLIIAIGDQKAKESKPYYYDVNVTNSNEAEVAFADNTTMFDINPNTGVISFTPTGYDLGIQHVNISVFNNCGVFSDDEIVQFTVVLENEAPYFSPNPPDNFTINQSELFTYDTNATDPDGDQITFGGNSTMFDIHPVTGVISFIPVQDDVGNHSVLIWIMDDHDPPHLNYTVILFQIIDVNDPPTLDPIGAQTAFINETYYYDVNATDPDTTLPHTLTFYDNTSLFNINPNTGVINFTPKDNDNGTYWINISVTDGLLWDWEVISFTVTKMNHPPNITSWYPQNYTVTIYEGENQFFNITKYDPDGTIPSTQWYLDKNLLSGETNDYYTYYASYTSAGKHNATVVISDGLLTDSHEWEIIVRYKPQPPPPPPTGGAPPSMFPTTSPPCIENWRCSPWPDCPEYEIQVRYCWDLKKCGTTFYKPNETQPCIYVPEPSCNDSIKDCHHGQCEILVDCGGPCPACPTCSDGIKNCHFKSSNSSWDQLCEEKIDCGGPCPPCTVPKPPPPARCGDEVCEADELFTCLSDCSFVLYGYFTIILIPAAIIILIYRFRLFFMMRLQKIEAILFKFFRKKKKPLLSRRQEITVSTLRKINELISKITVDNVRLVSDEFSNTMREFFAVFFSIRYKFTYVELNEELVKKKEISKELKDRVIEFSIRISEIEYSGYEPTMKEILDVMRNAKIIVERLSGIKTYEALKEKPEIKEEIEKKVKIKPKETEKTEEIIKRLEEVKKKIKEEKPKPVERAVKPAREIKPEAKPKEAKPKISIAELKEREKINELKDLLDIGEEALNKKDMNRAVEIYSRVREIYDNIPEDKKKELYNETIRIIRLYNNIVSAYQGQSE